MAAGFGLVGAPAQAAPVADAPGWTWEVVGDGVRYASPRGTFTVPNAGGFVTEHGRLGGGRGALGYPTGPVLTDARGSYVTFERGVVYRSARGTFAVKGGGSPFARVHASAGGGSGGALGYPVGREVSQGGGYWYQSFETGVIYVSPRGSYAVSARAEAGFASQQTFGAAHTRNGGGGGKLGYPTSGRVSEGGRYAYQQFERGTIYCGGYSADWYGDLSPACAAVRGGFRAIHASYGGGRGSLGYPMLDEIAWDTDCEGVAQPVEWETVFERGTVYVSATGAVSVGWYPPPLHWC